MSRSNGRTGSLRAHIDRRPRISTTLLALAIASSLLTVPYASSGGRALAASSASRARDGAPAAPAPQRANSGSLRASSAHLPLSIEANRGQANRQVKFLAASIDTITEFPIPTSYSDPIGITAGPDGNLWFTEYLGANHGRRQPYIGA
jgi:hypothetical protein